MKYSNGHRGQGTSNGQAHLFHQPTSCCLRIGLVRFGLVVSDWGNHPILESARGWG
jgi:hypothetical protein